jgi:hypothetical protein
MHWAELVAGSGKGCEIFGVDTCLGSGPEGPRGRDYHAEASVTADIDAWLPRVRPGDWISGDDYDPEKWPSVVAAVRARVPGAEAWTAGQWRWMVR